MLEQNPRSILLLGLADALASDLQAALRQQSWEVRSEPQRLDPAQPAPDLIFCGAEPARYLALLEEVKRQTPGLPVIVVGRFPETADWLDALEAGASDYCAPPFDRRHLQWMVSGALKSRALAA